MDILCKFVFVFSFQIWTVSELITYPHLILLQLSCALTSQLQWKAFINKSNNGMSWDVKNSVSALGKYNSICLKLFLLLLFFLHYIVNSCLVLYCVFFGHILGTRHGEKSWTFLHCPSCVQGNLLLLLGFAIFVFLSILCSGKNV